MKKVTLKNGIEAKLDVWNYYELSDYILENQNLFNKISGFRSLGRSSLRYLNNLLNIREYSQCEDLSPLEIQKLEPGEELNRKFIYDRTYTRSIVAFDSKLIGILICDWINNGKPDFWRYHVHYVDVHVDYRNIDVATNMIKALDEADFLKSKILQTGMYSQDGHAFIKKHFDRLEAKNFALIDREFRIQALPLYPGKYSNNGELIS